MNPDAPAYPITNSPTIGAMWAHFRNTCGEPKILRFDKYTKALFAYLDNDGKKAKQCFRVNFDIPTLSEFDHYMNYTPCNQNQQ